MAKSRVTKGPKGVEPAQQKSDKVKVKLSLSREVLRRLQVLQLGTGSASIGQVVDDLVMSAPQRFYLVDRGKGSQGVEGPEHPPASSRPPGLSVLSEVG